MRSKTLSLLLYNLLFIALLAGCKGTSAVVPPNTAPVTKPSASAAATTNAPVESTPTTAPTITPTPEPLALRVNDEGISLAEFQAELAQLQEADLILKTNSTLEQQRQKVLDNLTDLALLAQTAFNNGFTLDDEALQAEWQRLSQQAGGEEALRGWLAKYNYSEAAFRSSLRRSMAAAWQRDQIASNVPEQAEQVHVRQIVVLDEATAQVALKQVSIPGASFDNYAFAYDPQVGGDLGWFPRGYLLQPEVEEAAFSMQPGEISGIIHSAIGYHIIQVIAREERPLSPDAQRYLQHKAVQDWLKEQRSQSKVDILVP